MENRFGIKDLFLATMFGVLIVVAVLAMKQYDRQMNKIVALNVQNEQLAKDMRDVRKDIRDVHDLISTAPLAPRPATDVAPSVEKPVSPFASLDDARAKPDFAEGDTLVINLPARVGKITPLVSSDIYGTTVQARVLESLLARDPETLKLKPLLAESVALATDGLTITYKLRPGVQFSDGTPLTSADCKFTFDLIMNETLDAARERSYYVDNGITCEAPDPRTVIYRLKKPYYEVLTVTGTAIVLPRHLYSKYTPQQINDNPGLLMGSGPYQLEQAGGWTPGKVIALARNQRYWGVAPGPNKIIYKEVQEEAVAATQLRNGDLDLMTATPEQFEALLKDPTVTGANNALPYTSMVGGYTYVGWNQRRGGKPTAFADKRVRQAMTLLIDRERLAKDLYLGYATVATGPFSSKGPQSNPAVKAWPYDVERAKALLAEAGYTDRDGSGVLRSADGTALQFAFMYPSSSEFSQRIALFIRDQLARGGVKLELKATDWPTMIDRIRKSDFEVVSLGWTSSIESDPYQIFHSSQIGDAGDNRTTYINKDLDALIEKARSEVDEETRMGLWRQVHAILAEDQPYTFLVERKTLLFHNKRIANIRPARMGLNFMQTEVMPLPWYVPTAQQKYTK